MNKAHKLKKNTDPRQVTLYRNVFCSRVSTAVVLCLCISFLLQPIERVYAQELQTSEVVTTEIINLAVDADLVNPEADKVEIIAEEPTKETSALVTNVSTSTLPQATTTEVSPELETVGTTTVFTDEEIKELLEDEGILDEVTVTESTTTASTTENPVAITNVFSDAVMQFDRNDCVTVEDGSFYCQEKKEEIEQGTDGMYALQDKDGDLEIFLQKNGELTQLTFNTIDDAAPSFDTKSNSIVWHRLVDDRYQIIAFDIENSVEVQLTADSVNNMEPSRSGSNTVWQRWNGDNWDIVLYDGKETKFLTDNPLHDIAPNVKGDLVMWNRLTPDNTQSIELYDIATKEYTTITDAEGGALSNPRMVLVYETEFANGDVVTKGYNVDTGEVTPLSNNPAELPEELPEPDATGETRALLQPKNPTKEDSEFTDYVFPPTDGPTSSSTVNQASSSSQVASLDLYIASSSPAVAGSTIQASTTQSVAEMTLDLNPPLKFDPNEHSDLIIPAYQAASIENSIVIPE